MAQSTSQDLPEIQAVRAEEKIVIDGRLDEVVWRREGYSDLVQRDPDEGAEPTEKTSVLIAYNEEGLFVAGTCFHSGPDSIVGGLARRDKFVESDWFWFWIDPNYDRQSGFGFAVNPDGSIIDEKLYQDILDEEDCELVPATMEMMADEYRRTVPKVNIREKLRLDRRAWGKK